MARPFMFTLAVDQELQLAMVQPSFAQDYNQLVKADLDYLARWLAWPSIDADEAFFLRFIQQSLIDYAHGKSLTCAMIYQGKVVGNISFNEIDITLKTATLGYWLASHWQGKGIVTRAARVLIDYGFEHLELEWIGLNAAEHNLASRAVAKRLGFSFKTIAANAELIGGQMLNHAVYHLEKQ